VTSLLVVRPSSLGDIVHALSLVDDVLRARPDAVIDWVAEEAFVELPGLCPAVRRTVPLGLRRWRHSPLARNTWREARAFRAKLRETSYDVVLDLQEQVKGALVSRAALGVRHGFDRASSREPVATLLDDVHHRVPRELHFVTRCRRLAGAALGYAVDGAPRWRWAPAGRASAMPSQPYVIAFHGTSRPGKLWPESHWRELLTGFAHARLAILAPWGNADEGARSQRLAYGIAGARVPPKQTLPELAALIARAELVIGVDTGLTHLAAALGTPVVSIFTETDPSGAGVAIAGVHARDVGGRGHVPSLDEVRAAAGDVLSRAPRC
jgi:heptosyltransferase I